MPDKAKPDDPAQSQRFIDMAHEVDATDISRNFDNMFKSVMLHKTPNQDKTALTPPEEGQKDCFLDKD